MREKIMNVGMPLGLIERLDKFLNTERAKTMGLSSRPDVMIMLLREFLEKEEKIAEKNIVYIVDVNEQLVKAGLKITDEGKLVGIKDNSIIGLDSDLKNKSHISHSKKK